MHFRRSPTSSSLTAGHPQRPFGGNHCLPVPRPVGDLCILKLGIWITKPPSFKSLAAFSYCACFHMFVVVRSSGLLCHSSHIQKAAGREFYHPPAASINRPCTTALLFLYHVQLSMVFVKFSQHHTPNHGSGSHILMRDAAAYGHCCNVIVHHVDVLSHALSFILISVFAIVQCHLAKECGLHHVRKSDEIVLPVGGEQPAETKLPGKHKEIDTPYQTYHEYGPNFVYINSG